ncbi:MAG TPA: NHL repeat-containing protein [Candidatus Brocadiaceae bacterium]
MANATLGESKRIFKTEGLARRLIRVVSYDMVGSALRACAILLGLLLTAQVAITPDARAGMSYVRSLNTHKSPFDLYHPWGLAVDLLGNVFVADTNHHRIVKFGPNGNPLLTFGKEGSGKGQLYYPNAVAIDDYTERVYVADTSNQRVSVFDLDGGFLFNFGKEGSGPGQLQDPNGIAVHAASVYVTEGRNNRVSIFSKHGKFFRSFGEYGTGPGQFTVPVGIAVIDGFNHSVFVTDQYGGRVEVFDDVGNFTTEFGSPGTGKGQLNFPDEIAVAKGIEPGELHIWVAESSYPSRVQEFVRAKNGAKYVPGQQIQNSPAALNQPHGVAVDGQGRLYVANTSEDEVYVYEDVDPVFRVGPTGVRDRLISTAGLWFLLSYNQADIMCDVLGNATVSVPLGTPVKFKLEASVDGFTGYKEMKMDLSTEQLGWIQQAWNQGKTIRVVAKFRGRCTDKFHVNKTIHFRM